MGLRIARGDDTVEIAATVGAVGGGDTLREVLRRPPNGLHLDAVKMLKRILNGDVKAQYLQREDDKLVLGYLRNAGLATRANDVDIIDDVRASLDLTHDSSP